MVKDWPPTCSVAEVIAPLKNMFQCPPSQGRLSAAPFLLPSSCPHEYVPSANAGVGKSAHAMRSRVPAVIPTRPTIDKRLPSFRPRDPFISLASVPSPQCHGGPACPTGRSVWRRNGLLHRPKVQRCGSAFRPTRVPSAARTRGASRTPRVRPNVIGEGYSSSSLRPRLAPAHRRPEPAVMSPTAITPSGITFSIPVKAVPPGGVTDVGETVVPSSGGVVSSGGVIVVGCTLVEVGGGVLVVGGSDVVVGGSDVVVGGSDVVVGGSDVVVVGGEVVPATQPLFHSAMFDPEKFTPADRTPGVLSSLSSS